MMQTNLTKLLMSLHDDCNELEKKIEMKVTSG